MPTLKRTRKHRPMVVAVSGGFDPLHIGHVRMFQAARTLGDRLVVILNNDNWLKDKKGFVFMSARERAELIGAFSFVDAVVVTDDRPGGKNLGVGRALARLKPAVFANGGDRKNTRDIAEAAVCKKYGIKMAFNVGTGGKVQSSSWMIHAARKPASRTLRPWGEYYGWDSGKGWNLKTIYVKPGKRLSLQYHRRREEWWLLLQGDASAVVHAASGERTVALKKGEVFRVKKKQVHRLASKRGGIIVEVAYGDFDERDIVRLDDDYGRHR